MLPGIAPSTKGGNRTKYQGRPSRRTSHTMAATSAMIINGANRSGGIQANGAYGRREGGGAANRTPSEVAVHGSEPDSQSRAAAMHRRASLPHPAPAIAK